MPEAPIDVAAIRDFFTGLQAASLPNSKPLTACPSCATPGTDPRAAAASRA
jgi:hypothetical protein